ncbi:hypothetical protein FHR32_006314 [Streptosporangium album]|uniref:Uncharacterized protein n=1 Tax=Streptosporangium album TaxID=47479 RepID=A0A7W7S113_9ACTN|nr:hypothetical protein [Streptosporangium album]MBB4941928.1 hypothetical protein [Streptosporangium album]
MTAQKQLAALEQTFPGYRINHDEVPGTWTAIRRASLSERENDANMEYVITRLSPEALASALSAQIELAHRLRATHIFTTP